MTAVDQSLLPKFPSIPGFPWRISNYRNNSDLDAWFSDGKGLHDVRGDQDGTSSRLIVGNQGFLDFTSFVFPTTLGVDLNGGTISITRKSGDSLLNWPKLPKLALDIQLWVDKNDFSALVSFNTTSGDPALVEADLLEEFNPFGSDHEVDNPNTELKKTSVSIIIQGRLKSLPHISSDDASHLDTLIAQKYVPYQAIPKGGKTDAELRALGKQLFPYTPYSYELAMSMYDWTTASFARLVFMKVFQYTSIAGSPLCKGDIANMIWKSNWNGYTPKDQYYMKSFMMQPATSLEEVQDQLDKVAPQLERFSDVENRLLEAAMKSMPRTSYIQKPQLFSGQPDIFQFHLERFGVEFLECPINQGPIADEMTWDFEDALNTFISAGKSIQTKMVWSFTDSCQDALHYSNGILLVVHNPPPRSTRAGLNLSSFVWDDASYITPLSDEDDKIEYTFPPLTRFKISDWYKNSKGTVVINLQVYKAESDQASTLDLSADTTQAMGIHWPWRLARPASEVYEKLYDEEKERKAAEKARELKGTVDPDALLRASITHNNHGRWCRCVNAVNEVLEVLN